MKSTLSRFTKTAALTLLMGTLMPIGTSTLYASNQIEAVSDKDLESFYLNNDKLYKTYNSASYDEMKKKDNKFRKNVLRAYKANENEKNKARESQAQASAKAQEDKNKLNAENAIRDTKAQNLTKNDFETYRAKIKASTNIMTKSGELEKKHSSANKLNKSGFMPGVSFKTIIEDALNNWTFDNAELNPDSSGYALSIYASYSNNIANDVKSNNAPTNMYKIILFLKKNTFEAASESPEIKTVTPIGIRDDMNGKAAVNLGRYTF